VLIVPLTAGVLLAVSLLLRKRTELAFLLAAMTAIAVLTVRTEAAEWETWHNVSPRARSELAEEIRVLNTLPPEQVVLTTKIVANTLMIYTSHYPFFSNQDYMYGASDAELAKRAVIQHALVPSETMSPREIFGTYYLNTALNAQQQCRVFSLFLKSNEACAVAPEQFLPAAWEDSAHAQPDAAQILDELKQDHVTYAFLPYIPPALQSHVEILWRSSGSLLLKLQYP
jgi:hypothetical protein